MITKRIDITLKTLFKRVLLEQCALLPQHLPLKNSRLQLFIVARIHQFNINARLQSNTKHSLFSVFTNAKIDC